jgi:hypothetical protein
LFLFGSWAKNLLANFLLENFVAEIKKFLYTKKFSTVHFFGNFYFESIGNKKS